MGDKTDKERERGGERERERRLEEKERELQLCFVQSSADGEFDIGMSVGLVVTPPVSRSAERKEGDAGPECRLALLRRAMGLALALLLLLLLLLLSTRTPL